MAQTFGPYELVELLGRGGMGEVYRARDTSRQRDVALKVLPPHLASDAVYLARFRRESLLAAQLSDPHIIPIHDFGEIDGRLFIDMRLVSGSDLSSVLEERGPLPVPTAVDIVGQVASALDAAHADGLLHRDVKPSNVMLTGLSADLVRRPPFAYLVDFGIARSSAQMTALTDTASGALGTIAYMAPERISGQVGDGRGDVYALACVLYEALTGAAPFQGEIVTLMYQHLNVDPPRPSAGRADVPAALDEVVRIGMAKDPDRRYATAGDLAFAAQDALEAGPPAASAPAAPVRPRPAPAPAVAAPQPRPTPAAPPPFLPRRPRPTTAAGPATGGPDAEQAPDDATRVSGPTWTDPPPQQQPARGDREPPRTTAGELLPTGTVTLLAAAVDSVTRLVRLAGDRYPDVLAEHRTALEAVWAAHGGIVVRAGADRSLVAFADADSAVAAAADAVRATRGPRADGLDVDVRLGLHTGEPVPTTDGYWGPDVDYAVRLAAAGHAGQVLVSATTAPLVGSEIEALGRLPLPDFPTPRPLLHLVVDGAGAAQFPRPRTPDGPRTGLPRAAGSVVGRAAELDDVTRRLSRGVRFVTLVGGPGVGTTGVAVEAAHRLSPRFESVGFAALDGLAHDAVPAALARAAGLPELLGTPLPARLADGLRDRRVLLVLDGMSPAVAQIVATLIAGCAGVHVLATTREPVQIAGADIVQIGPLAVPPPGASAADVLANPAVRLLLDSVGGPAAGADEEAAAGALADLVRVLGGNPGALRLAGAAASGDGPLVERVQAVGAELSPGDAHTVVRRVTERASAGARDVLRALAGAGTALSPRVVRAAVGDGVELLPELVAAGLVEAVADGRFVVPPSVREVVDDDPATAATAVAAGLATPAEPGGGRELDGEAWTVLAALAATRHAHPQLHARLAAAAAPALGPAGHAESAREHLEAALDRSPGDPVTAARCRGILAVLRGDAAAALDAADRFRAAGDAAGESSALIAAAELTVARGGDAAPVLARARAAVGSAPDPAAAGRRLDLVEALAEVVAGDAAAASMRVADVLDAERPGTAARARTASVAADIALAAGDPDRALGLFATALRDADPPGPPVEPLGAADGVATALLELGRNDDAAAVLAMCDAVHTELAWPASARLLEARRRVGEVSGPDRRAAARARAATYSAAEALAWIARLAGGGRTAPATGA